MKCAMCLLWATITVAPGIVRAQGQEMVRGKQDVGAGPFSAHFPPFTSYDRAGDTSAAYVQKVAGLIKTAQENQMAVMIDTALADAKTLAALDPESIEQVLVFAPGEEVSRMLGKLGPGVKNGVTVFKTNASYVEKVTALIAAAQEKDMAIVVNGKAVEGSALAALDVTKIVRANNFPGDSEAVDLYGPKAKNGVLVMVMRSPKLPSGAPLP